MYKQVEAQEVRDARWKRFGKELEEYERKENYQRTLDTLLEVYAIKPRTWLVKYRLVALLFELRRLNSNVSMTLEL